MQVGIEVIGEAADGREAVEASRRLRPDVVVLMDFAGVRQQPSDRIQIGHRPGRAELGWPSR